MTMQANNYVNPTTGQPALSEYHRLQSMIQASNDAVELSICKVLMDGAESDYGGAWRMYGLALTAEFNKRDYYLQSKI